MLIRKLTGNSRYMNDNELFGVELECESKKPWKTTNIKGWVVKGDGSLRDYGVEFVSNGPLSEDTRRTEIEYVCEVINSHNPTINSPRTSVHVHYNCSNKTVVSTMNLAFTYWLLEDLFFEFFGIIRKTSPFCVPITACEQSLELVNDVMCSKQSFLILDPNMCKYAGLNLATIKQFNTLEFRGMGGVYEPELINGWLDCIKAMDNFSKRFKDPSEIIDYAYNKKDNLRLIDDIIPKTLMFNSIIRKVEEETKQLDNSMCVLAATAYNTKWEESTVVGIEELMNIPMQGLE